MSESVSLVGLQVHAAQPLAAVLDAPPGAVASHEMGAGIRGTSHPENRLTTDGRTRVMQRRPARMSPRLAMRRRQATITVSGVTAAFGRSGPNS